MAWDDTKVDVTDDLLAADWNAMVTAIKAKLTFNTEKKDGSDCSLTDGVVSRVLTLTNTTLSSDEIVIIGKQVLQEGEYTASHLVASSTITFTNAIYDAQAIIVRYQS